jgi:hypothetical protein
MKPRVKIINHVGRRRTGDAENEQEAVILMGRAAFCVREITSRAKANAQITGRELAQLKQAVKLLESVAY